MNPKPGDLVVVTELAPRNHLLEDEDYFKVGDVVQFCCDGLHCAGHYVKHRGAYPSKSGKGWFVLTCKVAGIGERASICTVRPATEAEEAVWRLGGEGG